MSIHNKRLLKELPRVRAMEAVECVFVSVDGDSVISEVMNLVLIFMIFPDVEYLCTESLSL